MNTEKIKLLTREIVLLHMALDKALKRGGTGKTYYMQIDKLQAKLDKLTGVCHHEWHSDHPEWDMQAYCIKCGKREE